MDVSTVNPGGEDGEGAAVELEEFQLPACGVLRELGELWGFIGKHAHVKGHGFDFVVGDTARREADDGGERVFEVGRCAARWIWPGGRAGCHLFPLSLGHRALWFIVLGGRS